jgi:phenylpropionate dioxygenase-like ring-hydroxylating dioxygenase large terminal subunit
MLTADELIERVFDHIDHRTTDRATRTWREPVANYLSQQRLDAELALIRSYPTPFCPSAALGEPGAFVARRAAGVELVAVRGADGRARGFLNSCRHRGTAVASGQGCATTLVCPYHGWTYRLDGSLSVVPHADGFPGLDRRTHGLVEVPAAERGGLVFVTAQPPAIEAFDPTAVREIVAPEAAVTGSNEMVIGANWKVFLEGFLEGYHIKSTHPETFLPFGFDNLNVIETAGRNARVTFPFRRIESQRDVERSQRRIDGMVTTVDHLFPNVIVAHLSHHTTVGILEPIDLATTRLVSYRLSRDARSESRADAARDSEFVERGIAEDREMVLRVQRGLTTGANDVFELGEFEGALTHFHANLHELLGEPAAWA